MTKPQLLKLNDQLTLWMEQIEDLSEKFNGSGNLTDDAHQFCREHMEGVGHTTDILLKSFYLHGVLRNLQFEVTEVILKKKYSAPTTVVELECPTCGHLTELAGYDGKGFICPNCHKRCVARDIK